MLDCCLSEWKHILELERFPKWRVVHWIDESFKFMAEVQCFSSMQNHVECEELRVHWIAIVDLASIKMSSVRAWGKVITKCITQSD